MTGRTVIGGKVMRAPDLERLDRVVYREPIDATPAAPVTKTNLFLDKDAPRTWARDKAELVALGVDGDVPLAQARVNAGLDPPPDLDLRGGFWVPRWLHRHVVATFGGDEGPEAIV